VITMVVPQLAVGGNGKTATSKVTANSGKSTPLGKTKGYLVGDGTGPNGMAVATGVAFPIKPKKGDYFLRLDFVPNRLFRWDGRRWVKIEDNVRTTLTPGPNNQTLRSSFVNNTNTFTNNSDQVTERQSLSQALKPKADN